MARCGMNGNFALAFNQWMDDYVNNPEAFEATAGAALRHLKERMNGAAPTYGESCEATLLAYLAKQEALKAA